jgi:hypothetical protein
MRPFFQFCNSGVCGNLKKVSKVDFYAGLHQNMSDRVGKK